MKAGIFILVSALVGVTLGVTCRLQDGQMEATCIRMCQRHGYDQGGLCNSEDGNCHCQGDSAKPNSVKLLHFVTGKKINKRLFWGPDYPDYGTGCDPDVCASICFDEHEYCDESYCDYYQGCVCGGPIDTC